VRSFFTTRRTGNLRGTLSLALVALLSVPARIGAQQGSAANDPDRSIKVNVDLVVLHVTVTDPKGKPFLGLKAENFRLLDNDTEQSLQHFSTQDLPFSMGLLLDRSGSMSMMIEEVYQAAFHTIRASKPADEFFIATFSEAFQVRQDFSHDRDLLQKRLKDITADGATALYDSILTAVKLVESGKHDKKALLVVTDGADNRSKVPFRELLELVQRENVSIYAVGLFGNGLLYLEDRRTIAELTQLAEVTGGKAYFPRTMKECDEACIAIAKELRQQYSLGYYPTPRMRDGAWHSVRLELQPPPEFSGKGITARTRAGYFAPRN